MSDLTPGAPSYRLVPKPPVRIVVAAIALVVAIVVVLRVVGGGSDTYEVVAKFQDAGQVVNGNHRVLVTRAAEQGETDSD